MASTTESMYLFLRPVTLGQMSCSEFCTSVDPVYFDCQIPLVGCFETERGMLGSARWFYIFLQGVILGLTLDIAFLAIFESIASVFNKWENYPTLSLQEHHLVQKVFLFNWVGVLVVVEYSFALNIHFEYCNI